MWAEAFLLAGRFFGDLAQKSTRFFHWLGHFAFAIFVLMVLGLMAHRILKQRKFLQQVRELRLEPEELKAMIDQAKEQGNKAPFIIDLRHPLDYLPTLGSCRAHCELGRTRSGSTARSFRVTEMWCCIAPARTRRPAPSLALQLHKLGIYRVRPLRGGFEGLEGRRVSAGRVRCGQARRGDSPGRDSSCAFRDEAGCSRCLKGLSSHGEVHRDCGLNLCGLPFSRNGLYRATRIASRAAALSISGPLRTWRLSMVPARDNRLYHHAA